MWANGVVGRAAVVALVAGVGLSAARAQITIWPADARGIRDFHGGGGPFLLGFMAIKRVTEDRTVMEFDVGGLSGTLPQVTLDLGLSNLDPGPPDGIIDVFDYVGDGVVTAPEFYAGGPTPTTSFVGRTGLHRVDVTSAVQAAVNASDQYIGFRLSSLTWDRYWVGSIAGQPDPVMTVIQVVKLGDLNCDGEVNFDDIDPFVLALGGEPGYLAQYPNCRWLNADINGDGTVNFDDIDPFVALLGG